MLARSRVDENRMRTVQFANAKTTKLLTEKAMDS